MSSTEEGNLKLKQLKQRQRLVLIISPILSASLAVGLTYAFKTSLIAGLAVTLGLAGGWLLPVCLAFTAIIGALFALSLVAVMLLRYSQKNKPKGIRQGYDDEMLIYQNQSLMLDIFFWPLLTALVLLFLFLMVASPPAFVFFVEAGGSLFVGLLIAAIFGAIAWLCINLMLMFSGFIERLNKPGSLRELPNGLRRGQANRSVTSSSSLDSNHAASRIPVVPTDQTEETDHESKTILRPLIGKKLVNSDPLSPESLD